MHLLDDQLGHHEIRPLKRLLQRRNDESSNQDVQFPQKLLDVMGICGPVDAHTVKKQLIDSALEVSEHGRDGFNVRESTLSQIGNESQQIAQTSVAKGALVESSVGRGRGAFRVQSGDVRGLDGVEVRVRGPEKVVGHFRRLRGWKRRRKWLQR